MSTLIRLAAMLIAVISVSACAIDDDEANPAAELLVWEATGADLGVLAESPRDATSLMQSPPDDVYVAPFGDEVEGLCACTSAKCSQTWIENNMGCGACVTAVCGGGRNAGGCSLCDDSERRMRRPAEGADVFAQ